VKGHYTEGLNRFIDEIFHDLILTAKQLASAKVIFICSLKTVFNPNLAVKQISPKKYSFRFIEIIPPAVEQIGHNVVPKKNHALSEWASLIAFCCFLGDKRHSWLRLQALRAPSFLPIAHLFNQGWASI